MHFELYVTDGSLSHIPLRNYHGVTHQHVPQNAIYCLNIPDEPPANELAYYEVGNILKLGNVRGKIYQGDLQFIWSNRTTAGQEAAGWRHRRPYLLFKEDPKSLAIEK